MSKLRIIRILVFLSLFGSLTSCELVDDWKFDDSEILNRLDSLENRVDIIESQLTQINVDINSITTLVTSIENKIYIEHVNTLQDGGYKITFTNGKEIVVKDGEPGKAPYIGTDGYWWIGDECTNVSAKGQDAPIIGVAEFEGRYYWEQVFEGSRSWLLDAFGNKLPVTGDAGVSPKLKVSTDGYWMISYDNGTSYTEMTDENGMWIKAEGKDGQDGAQGPQGEQGIQGVPGINGDSFFSEVIVEEDCVIFILLDGTELKLQKVNDDNVLNSLEGIVKTDAAIGEWDVAYITKYGYLCFKNGLFEDEIISTNNFNSLTYMDHEGDNVISIISTKNDNIPTQMVTKDGVLYFSFANDTILELIYDNSLVLSLIDSVSYNKNELPGFSDELSGDTLKSIIANITHLLNNSDISHESELIVIDSLKEKLNKINTESYNTDSDVLSKIDIDDSGNYKFSNIILEWYNNQIEDKVQNILSLWTGNATFKVGGSSCTLSGTVWCPSVDFNNYGVYGIICDDDIDNMLLGSAEYDGVGYQSDADLSFEVDFRGLKPNTTYYYRSYYKFNSDDHGSIVSKYGGADDDIIYDPTIKSFTTGENYLTVEVIMCIDITGSMSDVINTVKRNAISFYDSFNERCNENGIQLTGLNTQVITFQDINVEGPDWLQVSSLYSLPAQQTQFNSYVNSISLGYGGDTPESGLDALEVAFQKTNDIDDGYHRQVIILWSDAPYLKGSYSNISVTELEGKWNALPSGRRMILFAPYGVEGSNSASWGNLDSWTNVFHESNLTSGFNNFDYILDAIIGELTSRSRVMGRSIGDFSIFRSNKK
ncbi:MAG: hypothetical protein E7071_01620 [Bacteroidales bacterium]|nr:hypothetical protein [Bacteroidales bacterium]